MNKKLILAIFTLCCITKLSSQVRTEFTEKEKMLQGIDAANIVAFSKENLIVGRIAPNDSLAWYDQLKRVKEFVASRDKGLLKYYDILVEATNELVNIQKLVYGSYVNKAFKREKDKASGLKALDTELVSFSDQIDASKLDISAIESQVNKLKKTKKDLSKLQSDLKWKTRFSSEAKSEDRREARDVLQRVAFSLELTVDKVLRDFQKVKDAASKATKK